MEISDAKDLLREQIRAAYADYAEALARHNADALAAMYEEDAVILVPGAAPIEGIGAIRAYCEGICALPYDFELSGFTVEHMLKAGDYVIEISRFTSVNTPCGDRDGRAVTKTKNLMVWRNRNGRWVIVREMHSDIRS